MKILVTGAGGFIGHHLVKRLKKDGHWVRGVSSRKPQYGDSLADEYLYLDLREKENCAKAVEGIDEVYQLAANMGGAGFIERAAAEIMHDSTLIDLYMTDAAAQAGVQKYLFTSSVCVYRDMEIGESEIDESTGLMPDNDYGYEKLYAEKILLAYARSFPMKAKIVRLQNTYGEEGAYQGGKEKAVAAICRKVALATDAVDVWGDGKQVRSYTHVDNVIDAILLYMNSELEGPVNIGSDRYISVDELTQLIMKVAGKKLKINHVPGPQGVRSRNFSNKRIRSLGWTEKVSLEEGLARTYAWISQQVSSDSNR